MNYIILGIILGIFTIILGVFALFRKDSRKIKIIHIIVSGLLTIVSFLNGSGGNNIEVSGNGTTIININSESIQADNIDDMIKRIKEFKSTSPKESEDTLTNEENTSSTYRIYQYAPHKSVTETNTYRNIYASNIGDYNAYKMSSGIYILTYELKLDNVPQGATFKSIKSFAAEISSMTFNEGLQAYIEKNYTTLPNGYIIDENLLLTNSLTQNNITASLTNPYYSFDKNCWFTMVRIDIRNLDNLSTLFNIESDTFYVPLRIETTCSYLIFDVDMSKAYWTVSSLIPTNYKLVDYKDITI